MDTCEGCGEHPASWLVTVDDGEERESVRLCGGCAGFSGMAAVATGLAFEIRPLDDGEGKQHA